ncbi:MAG TPA: cell envelope integrity protein CreD [Vicinamibacterales bacterium]|nr:cell envelope integrity protein CreD [Vicinamibacterales bacterium]
MRTSAMARLFVMGALMLGMLIPLQMIQSVVSERTTRRDAAQQEIGSTWGGFQTVGGPVLIVPYRHVRTDNDGVARTAIQRAFVLPEALDVKGTLQPTVLRRGLFKVVVYRAHLTISGRFVRPDLAAVRPAPSEILWDDAAIAVGISDPRGLATRLTITWMGRESPLEPGAEEVAIFASGLHTRAAGIGVLADRASIPFTLDLDLNGSRDLRLLPTGSDTSLQLTSPWPHPSFVGAPLPASREIGPNGFTARWTVPYFSRGYPPQWTGSSIDRAQMRVQADASSFGVSLVQPVDIYQQAERAVKYAALFIVMTFVVFFLWEIGRGRLLHPIQYSFVGFAMCVFYLLLVSLSEHLGFDVAYVCASIATTALIAVYSAHVLGGAAEGAAMGGGLVLLYGFLYLLLRLEDYALLAGSIGLFSMLALLMYATRRVNWYELRLGEAKQP